MKAWSIFLFMWAFQSVVWVFLSSFGFVVVEGAIVLPEIENNASAIASGNEYIASSLYGESKFSNMWDSWYKILMPTGSFISLFFPEMPEIMVIMFNSLWGVLATVAVLEFMRGFNIMEG